MKKALILLIAASVVGCTGLPRHSPAYQARMHLDQGNASAAARILATTFTYDDESSRQAIRYLASDEGKPRVQDLYRYHLNSLELASSLEEFARIEAQTRRFAQAGIYSAEQRDKLNDRLDQLIYEGSRDGRLKITLSDMLARRPSLNEPSARDTIFRTTLDRLASGEAIHIFALNNYALSGATEAQKSELREFIRTSDLSPDQLSMFSGAFPGAVEEKLNNYRVNISLKFAQGDDPLILDVYDIIQTHPLVSDKPVSEASSYTLHFDSFIVSERQIPERTETKRYAAHEVNMWGAALTMPRGASYLFDRRTGGFSVSYRVSATLLQGNNVVTTKAFSDTIESTFSYCDNARIQNVFGGVQSAQFVANNEMARMCSEDTRSIDYRDTYKKAAARISDEILDIPEIRRRIRP